MVIKVFLSCIARMRDSDEKEPSKVNEVPGALQDPIFFLGCTILENVVGSCEYMYFFSKMPLNLHSIDT
jgi:hypothetical protein